MAMKDNTINFQRSDNSWIFRSELWLGWATYLEPQNTRRQVSLVFFYHGYDNEGSIPRRFTFHLTFLVSKGVIDKGL